MVFKQEHSLDIPQYGPTLQISDLTPSVTASGSPYKKFVDCFPLDKSDSYGSQEVGEKKKDLWANTMEKTEAQHTMEHQLP